MSAELNELEALLIDWEAGELDDRGVSRVQEILRSSEAARDLYLRHQMIAAALRQDGDAGMPATNVTAEGSSTSSEPAKTPPPAKSKPREVKPKALRWTYWAVAVASVLICLLVGRVTYLELTDDSSAAADNSPNANRRDDEEEATASGVALVTRLVDVAWHEQQPPLEVGDALPPGKLAIASGLAQIEFFCGATVIVEGPAELELKSSTLAMVRRGRLRAHVPPAARGFSLEADGMKVVDLGTEFGLAVSSEGADVQVFDGEVELHPESAEKQRLTTGDSVARTADGKFEKGPYTPERFLDIAALQARADGQQTARFQKWKAWSEDLRRDPRLIAYYAFDETSEWNRKLPSSALPKNTELDGAVVGAHRTTGRWPAKSGLEFKRPGDRVRVQIPGEFASLTFACWVRIDSLDRWYNSLFLTDHYNQGEPHWQILDTGQLFFSVRYKPDDATGEQMEKPTHQKVLSPPFWKPSLSGRWLHLAVTYDAAAGRTTHYLNGEVLHEEKIAKDLHVKTTRIGAASIGNWSIPTRPDAANLPFAT